MELIKAAIGFLHHTDEHQQDDLHLVIPSFSHCQIVSLQTGDLAGFHWSLQILQGIIRQRLKRKPYGTIDELFTCLLNSFVRSAHEEVESSEALAAFHVAKFASTRLSLEGTELWYWKCLLAAKTNCLRYLASTGLGVLLLKLDRKQEALGCFKAAIEYAENVDADSIAIASYWAAKVCVLLGNESQAMEIFVEAGSGSFVSALAVALYSDMIKARDGASLQVIIGGYTTARTRLAKLMPDLMKLLTDYCGGAPPCASEFLLKFVNLDQFSAFFILEASKFPLEIRQPVERSFFVFELACEFRKEMLTIQEQLLPTEVFLDPRPHLEQGIEIFIVSKAEDTDALTQLVISQQIALQAGDLACYELASDHIMTYIRVQQEMQLSQDQKLRGDLLRCFQHKGADGEDPEAWTLFYIGRSGINEAYKFSSETSYQMVKQALQISKTPTLAYRATEILAAHPDCEVQTLEQMVAYARQIGKTELIITALTSSFQTALFRLWKIDRAESSYMEMLELSRTTSAEMDKRLARALAMYMLGMTLLFLLDFQGYDLIDKAVKELNLLPQYPALGRLHFYLSEQFVDGWSNERNFCAQLVLRNASKGQAKLDISFGKKLEGETVKFLRTLERLERIQLLISEGDLEEAEYEAAEALQALESTDSNFILRAWATVYLASLACSHHLRGINDGLTRTRHQLDETLAIMQEFVDEALELVTENQKIIVDFGAAALIHQFHSQLLSSLGEKAAALRELEEYLRLACLEMDSSFGQRSWARIRKIDNLRPFFKALHSSMWELNELQRALVWGERERARDFLYTLQSRGDREKYMENFVEFDTSLEKAWLEIKGICEVVGRDTVFIVISQRQLLDVVYTLFIHSDDAQLVGRRHQGFTPVTEVVKAITTGSSSTWELLAEYYNIFVKPFAEELEAIQPKRIIFIPSEDMCLVPFAALFDWDNKLHLIEKYDVATAPSLRFFKHCHLRGRELQEQQAKKDHSKALVVGNPTSDLGYADAEAACVEDILREAGYCVTTLGNAGATKKILISRLPESSWVHIASHASANLQSQGALRLSPPDQTFDDEYLTSNELQVLLEALEATSVVLSACSSGVGEIHAEGVMALPRVLHLKGAASVVFSLWEVDDEATQVVMEKMYLKLQTGLELAEALRIAMVDSIEAGFGPASDVRFWGAFVISGSPFIKLH